MLCVISQAVERAMRSHFRISLLLFATRKAEYSARSFNPVTVVLRKRFDMCPHYVGVAPLSIFWGNFVLAKVLWEVISVCCQELRGVGFLEVRNAMLKLIGGNWAIRFTEVVHFSEGSLLEVLLLRIQIQSHSRFMQQIPGYIDETWTRRTLPVVKMRLWPFAT